MSSVQLTCVSDAGRFETEREEWRKDPQGTFRLHLLTIREEDGTYSTIALNLPGAGSCGDSKEESIANAKEAIKAVLESYQEAGDPIPWRDSTCETIPDGEQKWFIVHA